MSTERIHSVLHYFGIEEENAMANIANLGEDYVLIRNLNNLYLLISSIKIKEITVNLKIPIFLYLISHSEFYAAVSSYLRLHQSKAFHSLRVAIDSALTSYYLLENPDQIEDYLSPSYGEETNEWQKTFRNIKATIKRNIKDYPHADGLPNIHEFCSMFSHADAAGILHRYHEEEGRLEAKYFDYDVSTDDYKKWLAQLLLGFSNIFELYWAVLFKPLAGDKTEGIESTIKEFKTNFSAFYKQYPLENAPEEAEKTREH